MRWGPIRKSINSNLNTPLNTLISGVQTTADTINTKATTINTNTARGAISSIQKGTVTCSNTSESTSVTISAVNAAKSFFILNGMYRTFNDARVMPPYGYLNSTTLTISGDATGTGGTAGRVSWQVIEFY